MEKAVSHDDIWDRHVSHTCIHAHVCACVYVIKEKAPCLGFSLTPKSRTPFICAEIYFKSHVGLCFLVLSEQVMWPYEERLIRAFKEDRLSSLRAYE